MTLTPTDAMKQIVNKFLTNATTYIVDDAGIPRCIIGIPENRKDESLIVFLTAIEKTENILQEDVQAIIEKATNMSLDGKYYVEEKENVFICYFIQSLEFNATRHKELALGKILYSGVSSLKSVLYDINALKTQKGG